MKNYFKTLWEDPKAASKFYVTLLGVLLMVATSALTPDLSWAQWAVAVLTALATYAVPNDSREAKFVRALRAHETGGRDNG